MINSNFPVDARAALGCEGTYKNCVKSISLPYGESEAQMPTEELCRHYKRLMNEQRTPERCKDEFNKIIMLLNAFVFPLLLQRQVEEIGYSDFLKMVDEQKVTQVSLDENGEQLIFIAKDENGSETIYKTAVFPDDSLRERLENAGVTFSAQIATRNSPLISFLISTLISLVIGFLIPMKKVSDNATKNMKPGIGKQCMEAFISDLLAPK